MIEFIDTPPIVQVVGVSLPTTYGFEAYRDQAGIDWKRDPFEYPDSLAVLAGAGCYRSFDNKAGRSDDDYLLESILKMDHGSVLEHVSLNFAVAHMSRSVLAELTRHRAGMAYSFESQRFCNHVIYVVPPLFRDNPEALAIFKETCTRDYAAYEALSAQASPEGGETGTLKRKRKREAARSVLNNAVATSGMVTMNARALRHIVTMRTDPHADASIRELAFLFFLRAYDHIPGLLQDHEMIEQPWGPPQVIFKGKHA